VQPDDEAPLWRAHFLCVAFNSRGLLRVIKQAVGCISRVCLLSHRRGHIHAEIVTSGCGSLFMLIYQVDRWQMSVSAEKRKDFKAGSVQ
jgi:hypothetical protein